MVNYLPVAAGTNLFGPVFATYQADPVITYAR